MSWITQDWTSGQLNALVKKIGEEKIVLGIPSVPPDRHQRFILNRPANAGNNSLGLRQTGGRTKNI